MNTRGRMVQVQTVTAVTVILLLNLYGILHNHTLHKKMIPRSTIAVK